MASFRFIHAADLHLDTPFSGIGRVAPNVREHLRDASLEAFDNLIQAAIDHDAAFLLLAGDLYDGAERGVRAQLRFLRGAERLAERGIRVFVVHGNHDPLDGWSAIRGNSDSLTMFGSQEVESHAVERDGERLATIHGISFATREVTENLALRFHRTPEAGLHIGLLHASAGRHADHEEYSPCSIDDLRAAGMDYWALGHIHQRQVLAGPDPWIVYPGNLQGRGVKSSELGTKGAMLVHAAAGRVEQVEVLELDCVRFQEVEVDIGGLADFDALRRSVWTQTDLLQTSSGGRDLIVRVVLTGRGPLRDDLRHDTAGGLLEDLRHQAAGLVPLVWFERITDRTRRSLDLEVILDRNDFSAEILRTAATLARDPDQWQAFLADVLAPLRKSRTPYLAEWESWDWTALLREAGDRALDLLESGQEP